MEGPARSSTSTANDPAIGYNLHATLARIAVGPPPNQDDGPTLPPPATGSSAVEADPAPTTRRLATLHYSEAAIIGWFQTFALLADSGELSHPVRRRPVPRGCRSQPWGGGFVGDPQAQVFDVVDRFVEQQCDVIVVEAVDDTAPAASSGH